MFANTLLTALTWCFTLNRMSPLDEALAADRVILSVMGPHAGESAAAIFSRKTADVAACGVTFWLYKSHTCAPHLAQAFRPTHAIFITAASRSGARPTTTSEAAAWYSADKNDWQKMPKISPVTGNLPGYALALSSLQSIEHGPTVDLWRYLDSSGSPLAFQLGASTLLAKRSPGSGSANGGMKSRFRRVLAVGRLVDPVAVHVR